MNQQELDVLRAQIQMETVRAAQREEALQTQIGFLQIEVASLRKPKRKPISQTVRGWFRYWFGYNATLASKSANDGSYKEKGTAKQAPASFVRPAQ